MGGTNILRAIASLLLLFCFVLFVCLFVLFVCLFVVCCLFFVFVFLLFFFSSARNLCILFSSTFFNPYSAQPFRLDGAMSLLRIFYSDSKTSTS